MKQTLKKIFVELQGDKLLNRVNRTPRVLFWHGVDNIVNSTVEAESFDVDVFKQQIDYLERNFEIISINELYLRLQENKFTNKEIVLTFDDGYTNNLHIVAPLLNEKSIPFTVFVSTEHIDTGELFPTSVARLVLYGSNISKVSIPTLSINNIDISSQSLKDSLYHNVSLELKQRPLNEVRKIVEELRNNVTKSDFFSLTEEYKSVKPMNWNEVKELNQLGATIGSHCKYHICCHANQDIGEVESQIKESKKIIEKNLQTECKYFAYPNGDYTTQSNQFVKEAGYKLGFSTNRDSKVSQFSDQAIIPRIGVPQNIDTFKILINLYPKR